MSSSQERMAWRRRRWPLAQTASRFETAQSRLLTMRRKRFRCVSIWSIFSSSSRWPRRAASPTARNRFISRWPRRARGSRDWRTALGVALLTRGRRGVELTPAGESLLDHARIVHPQCRGDARRSPGLCPRREGHRPLPRQHVGPFGISAEGAGRLPGRASPHLDRRRGTRKLRYRPRHR